MLNWVRDLDAGGPEQRRGPKLPGPRNLLLRTGHSENQAYRASGLNLVVAAIILWNSRYLDLAATDLDEVPETSCERSSAAPHAGWLFVSERGRPLTR
jgi:hypothetical protein